MYSVIVNNFEVVEFHNYFLSRLCRQVSVGYFLSDLAMIFWFRPSLGGMEYVSYTLILCSAFYSYIIVVEL